jgi:hypothetical protein
MDQDKAIVSQGTVSHRNIFPLQPYCAPNIKAQFGRILVKAYLNQKDAIQIVGADGKTVELWMGKKYLENYRQKNPVICTVIGNASTFDYIHEGDQLLVHHNYLSDPVQNPYCIEYNAQTGEAFFGVPASEAIFAKLNEDGTIQPVCHNIIAKRLKNPIISTLYIPDTVKQEHNDRVEVIAVAPEIKTIKPGMTILIYKMADYEICYTFNKKEYSAIRIWGQDVIGFLN